MSVDLNFNSDWGGPVATSYLSVADADEIAAMVLASSSSWVDLVDSVKETYLMQSARSIDSLHYIGELAYTDQILKWPRIVSRKEWTTRYIGLQDDDRFQRKSKFDIQVACLLEAVNRYTLAGKTDHAEMSSKGIKQYSKSVGPIREQYTYGDQGGSMAVGASAMNILRLYTRARGLVRG